MDEYYTWDTGSVWHKHWPETIYVGQWPIFHGPVILRYIFKDYLAILNYLPISAYSGLLKFDMKMFVNITMLDISQLLLKARGGVIRVLWTHF